MRTKLFTRIACTVVALGLVLAGCEDIVVPVIQHSVPHTGGVGDGGPGSYRRNNCLLEALYLVEDDTFTRLSSALQTFGSGSSSQGSASWPSDIEARAQSRLDIDGYNGVALLLWNDAVVDSFRINKTFLMSDQVAILAHDDPDGTRVEFHVYAKPSCEGASPGDVSTRAEIEALER